METAAARKIFKKNAGSADNLGWMIWKAEFLRNPSGVSGGFPDPKTSDSSVSEL